MTGTPGAADDLIVLGDAQWRSWLTEQGQGSDGVWLVLARRGCTGPTTLTYDQALEEALCQGWIDGRRRSRDDATFRQRFTPRRSRSIWSRRNAEAAMRLISEGRMHQAGLVEVERARADGRWDAAYAGQGAIEVPEDLAAAMANRPRALEMFAILTSQNRYAILFRIGGAKRADTRARRIAHFVEMLERGETVYPQRRRLDA